MTPSRTTESAWASRTMRAVLALLALMVALSAFPLAWQEPVAQAQEETEEAALVPGEEVIVVLEPGEDPEIAARQMGVEVTHIYRNVFTGFAGTVLPPSEQPVTAARARRKARDISPDGEVHIEAQEIPTGVRRAGTPVDEDNEHLDLPQSLKNTLEANVDIAIIDTGISELPDLNVVGGFNCTSSDINAWQDDNGHGTHVAGIAAAKDNNDGIVGVAPGARLWAVKVLDANGSGSFSDVICGIDRVIGRGDIEVINLSLSGEDRIGNCTSPPLHRTICHAVDAGITVVAAAGNQSTNARKRVPAAYPEVMTVSAISDLDGQPGKLASGRCDGNRDDVFADFSNYGSPVDIAAPGVCIESYRTGGSTVRFSGTSQAAPHVAGAAADFIASGGSSSPEAVEAWLLNQASRPQAVDGVTGDPDSLQARKKAKRKKIRKLRKKRRKADNKKKRKRLKKKLRKARQQKVSEGKVEPVLWLESLNP